MSQEFPTIYRAKNLQEAHLLSNILEEEGIQATITNEVLQGGSGVDIVGWPTLPQVMVAEADSVRARKIAMDFDSGSSNMAQEMQNSERTMPDEDIVDAWPCCPECGKRRLTRCKICGTSGTDFPPADANTGDLLGLPMPSAGAFSSCSCGPGGCGKHEAETKEEASAEEYGEAAPTADPPAETASPPLLICPTCDEPFHPQYLRRCEWCGHEFADGADFTSNQEKESDTSGLNRHWIFIAIFCGYIVLSFSMANGVNVTLGILLAVLLIIFEMFLIFRKHHDSNDSNATSTNVSKEDTV